MITVGDISAKSCCGCAACMDNCPVGAINMHYDKDFNRVPLVNNNICISCGQCVKVCPNYNESIRKGEDNNTIYLGTYKNRNVEKFSSSGGLFAALALEVLKQGGVVYGASMLFENEIIQCRHMRIDNINDLHYLQGSKYVQSRTDGIFKSVKTDIKEGRVVLFSGTSCQVASLKRFVGESNQLYTIDLICHGVPKDQLFRDYVEYYENRFGCKIIDISFRTKGVVWHQKEMRYVLTLTCNKNGILKKQEIIEPKSSFYSLFISRAGYRESCYYCHYASIYKPADITLGDYIMTVRESEKYRLPLDRAYSTIIVRSEAGKHLLELIKDSLIMSEAFSDEVIARHSNLNHPSVVTPEGEKLYSAYIKGGFSNLQRIINYSLFKTNVKWMIKLTPMTLKTLLRFCK